MSHYDSIDVCRQIRLDYAEDRLDAGKGKKCPGGYWIPANKQCGKPGQAGKSGRMRSPGGGRMARNLAIGAAGLAATAGGAALAYKNRDKIIAGVDKAGSAATRKATEMKIAVRKGVGQVQGKIQEASEKTGKAVIGASRRASMATTKIAKGASAGVRKVASQAEEGVAQVKSTAAEAQTTVNRATRRAGRVAKATVGHASRAAERAKETFSNIAGGGEKKEEKKADS